MAKSSPSTRIVILFVLAALTVEVWQLRQTALLEEELAAVEQTKPPTAHAAPKPPPVVVDAPAPEFTGEAAEPGKPLTLADGSVVTVKDSTPRSVTVHRPANTGTLLAEIDGEVRQISVDDLKNNPDLMNQLTGAAKTSAQREFANYLKQSGLTAEQQAQFQATMADRTSQIWLAALQVATKGDLTADQLAALNQQVSEIEQTAQASLRPLYASDDDFAALQTYQAQGAAQGVLSTLGQMVHDPLTPEQSDAISGIVAEEYAKANLPEPMVVGILWGLNSDLPPLTGEFQQMETSIEDRLAAVLTPSQADQLKSSPGSAGRLKNGVMRTTSSFESAIDRGSMTGGGSADTPKFKFFPGERSGMGSGGGGFGYTMSGPNGSSYSKDYFEVDIHTD